MKSGSRSGWRGGRRTGKAATSGLALVLLASPASAGQQPTIYQRAIAAGYEAAMLCSGMFVAGRTEAQVKGDELRGIYSEYDAIIPSLHTTVDRRIGLVTVPFDPAMPPRRAVWRQGQGCTTMPIGTLAPPAIDSDEPQPAVRADPRRWPLGDAGIAPRPSTALAARIAAAFDCAIYGERSETIGVLVMRDGRVMGERYRQGFGPFVPNRTWSVAKSISGTLVGMAASEAAISPERPANIPEWITGPAFNIRSRITLDDLLRMASGLHSGAAGNRTDAIYFGGTSVTDEATAWFAEAKPGTRFRYANDDILLAVRSMRASLGEKRYRNFPAHALFAPLGMAHTIAEKDWAGNYILSSQVWSTARDLARLGQFWLDDGVWAGKRLLPEGWMRYMTTPSGPQPTDGPGYGATMWLFGPKQGLPAGSYAAQGNRGQYVMVIPSRRLVIVRRGEDPGVARFDIARFSADVIGALR